ncbi:MAG TPA: RnfABCDGE type electron transport complex subunit C [Spirochaetia bacterium]|nr:RnfABCDGE type electron transport complex subunit C [Spirochaetales bacterium]HRW23405.1 RnfABCDGE type electron transport complex subunit C [Spirochaetia bacterium]
MRARGFKRGGVPVDHRAPFKTGPIENAFLPMNAIVQLREHRCAVEPIPVVSVGQEVREGQLLARSAGKASSNVHSPIPGIVRRIETTRTPGGFDSKAILVSLEGSFSMLGKRPERYLWKSLNKADIAHIVQDKGIVRVSSGEPLYEILSERSDAPGFVMVVSALEMDPYRRTEEELLALRAEDVVDGCAIAARMALPSRIVFAVDERIEPATLEPLRELAARSELDIAIQRFRRRFPQDLPGQIAEAMDIVDPGTLFIIEPSTLVALHEAVVSNKPHIEQYVYVGGGSIKRPAILKARIGAPIGDLIEECGGFSGHPETIVIGGPFRGRAAADLDAPVTRTTRAVLALSPEETKSAPERPCVRCGDCVDACPEGLSPYRLLKLLRSGRPDEALAAGLGRCSSCGSCSYACRSRIPLVRYFDEARQNEVRR